MSDSFAGLTRRINEFVHDRETSEELSHILDEARDHGGDAADALIELALGETYDGDDELEGEGAELAAIVEDDELVEDEVSDEEVSEEGIDADLAALEEGLDEEDADDDLLAAESASLQLAAGEVLVI